MMEYSPNQAFDKDTPKDLNKKNLEKLFQNLSDDTVRFVLTGDSQRAYKNAEDLVSVINKQRGVDFVILAGDISDFGLVGEMEWVNEIFSNLKAPYIGVIGNHDLVANGEKVYTRMYGPLNFSFTYQGVKFICHNTNCREVNFDGTVPNMTWLAQEFKPTPDVSAYVAVGHVPPSSVDFDENMRADYTKLLGSGNVTLAGLYAHNHSEDVEYMYEGRIPCLITNSIIKRQFLMVEIVNGRLSYESISY